MEKQPKVTVLMTVYNGGHYIQESILSILRQDFQEFELLIMNDASTDETVQYIHALADPRIRLVNLEKNIGQAPALNQGMDLARGDYIARMDADDIAHPKRLLLQFKFMETHPSIVLLGSTTIPFGQKRNDSAGQYPMPRYPMQRWRFPIEHDRIQAGMLLGCQMSHPSVMMRRTFFDQHGLRYNPSYQPAEDYDLWTRAMEYGKLANLKDSLLYYRCHASQLSSQRRDLQYTNARRVRQHLFDKWSQNFSEAELSLHEAIACGQFTPSVHFLEEAHTWFDKLLETNRNVPFFNQGALKETLAFHWLKLNLKHRSLGLKTWSCYRHSGLGKFYLADRPWMNPLLFLAGATYSSKAVFGK